MGWNVISVRPGIANQRSRVHLEGVEYILDLRWNTRASIWFLDFRDAAGALLLSGLALALLEPHLRVPRGSIVGLPPGELTLIDPRSRRAYPGLAELGDQVQLVYIDAEHVAASGGSTAPVYSWGAAA